MTKETAVTIDTSSVKFGRGVTREAGYELKRLGATKVMVVTDQVMASSDAVRLVLESLDAENVLGVLYDRHRR